MKLLARHGTAALIVLAATAISPAAHADGMVPETSVVIVDEKSGEGSINVRNSDSVTALLHTTIANIPEDTEQLLVLTPPVARVDAGDTQLVRFILQSSAPLKTERLKRVTFEGIKAQEPAAGPRVAMSVRHNIPVILRPANLPVERSPWTRLTWTLRGDTLVVNNPSPYVVRLANTVNLLPANQLVELGRSYVLPGEELSLQLTETGHRSATGVRLAPATTYGYAVAPYDAPLAQN